jgi:hypothetical protein
LSIGVQSKPELFSSPKTLEVNGQTVTVNSVLRSPRLREVSFVPVAADENAALVSVFSQDFSQDLDQESSVEITELQDRLTSALAVNAELNAKLNAEHDDHVKVMTALNAQLSAEREAVNAANERAAQCETQLQQFKTEMRKSAVESLFADLHRDYSDEAAAPYVEMSEVAFAAVSADLRSLKPVVKAEFFKDVATSGKSAERSEHELSVQLFNQVAGRN